MRFHKYGLIRLHYISLHSCVSFNLLNFKVFDQLKLFYYKKSLRNDVEMTEYLWLIWKSDSEGLRYKNEVLLKCMKAQKLCHKLKKREADFLNTFDICIDLFKFLIPTSKGIWYQNEGTMKLIPSLMILIFDMILDLWLLHLSYDVESASDWLFMVVNLKVF